METKQIPKKHIGKSTTEAQKEIIEGIQKADKCAYLEAKHKYFENQKMYDSMKQHIETFKKTDNKIAEQIAAETNIEDIVKEAREKKAKMTVAETKLGVTVVLSHADCEMMGFDNETALPKDVIDMVRKKLGLYSREQIKADRKAMAKQTPQGE